MESHFSLQNFSLMACVEVFLQFSVVTYLAWHFHSNVCRISAHGASKKLKGFINCKTLSFHRNKIVQDWHESSQATCSKRQIYFLCINETLCCMQTHTKKTFFTCETWNRACSELWVKANLRLCLSEDIQINRQIKLFIRIIFLWNVVLYRYLCTKSTTRIEVNFKNAKRFLTKTRIACYLIYLCFAVVQFFGQIRSLKNST